MVSGHHRPDVEVDVVEGVDEAATVVDVVTGRVPERVGRVVVHQHGRTTGAEVHAVAADLDRLRLVPRVPGELLGRGLDRLLDDRLRVVEPVALHPAARRGHDLDELRDGRSHPDVLEQPDGGVVDLLEIRFGQRLVEPARESRADRPHVLFERRLPRGDASGTTAGASTDGSVGHLVIPLIRWVDGAALRRGWPRWSGRRRVRRARWPCGGRRASGSRTSSRAPRTRAPRTRRRGSCRPSGRRRHCRRCP